MAEPFLSEVRMFSFNYPPKGWAFCNGQLLPINQNQALFSLLGTTFGGDGRTTFALPDMRGRTPIHTGNNHPLGERSGQAAHTLSTPEMPEHTHEANGSMSLQPGVQSPQGALLGRATTQVYSTPQNLQPLNPASIAPSGNSQPHTNMQPFLVINFCIALQGIFPSPN